MKDKIIPQKYVAWDLETTGFDGTKNHILEIGMMVFVNEKLVDEKRWVLKHDIKIPEEITAINGMTNEIMEAEGRDPVECLNEFIPFLKEAEMNLTHNGVKFDIPFLVKAITKHLNMDPFEIMALDDHLFETALDTAAMYKGMMFDMEQGKEETFESYANRVLSTMVKGLKYNVGAVCDHFEIDTSQITKHRALGDVFLTNEIFKRLWV